MFGTFMEVLDTTVVNVSLPHIAGNLSATPEEATWALTSYLVANAIILPITGWLANYFGRKRLLMSAVVGFTRPRSSAASRRPCVACDFSNHSRTDRRRPSTVIAGCDAGGVSAAQQGKAMGVWGLGSSWHHVRSRLGGWLTDNYSGDGSFTSTSGRNRFDHHDEILYLRPAVYTQSGTRVDKWGIGMLAVGIAHSSSFWTRPAGRWFSSNWITSLLILSVAMLALFIVHELRTADPVIHLRVFKNRTYSTGVFLMTTLGFVLYGSLVLLPLFLQTCWAIPRWQPVLQWLPEVWDLSSRCPWSAC